MSSAYERLVSLFGLTGLDVSQGTYAEAEAYALSSGIQLVSEKLNGVKEQIFFTLFPSENELKKWLSLLLPAGGNIENGELINLLTARLSHNFGEAQLLNKLDEERIPAGGFTFTVNGDVITVSGVDSNNLLFLGRFLKGFLPPGKTAVLEGRGLTFRQWNRRSRTFGFYDRLQLPFSCIDTLSSDLITL